MFDEDEPAGKGRAECAEELVLPRAFIHRIIRAGVSFSSYLLCSSGSSRLLPLHKPYSSFGRMSPSIFIFYNYVLSVM